MANSMFMFSGLVLCNSIKAAVCCPSSTAFYSSLYTTFAPSTSTILRNFAKSTISKSNTASVEAIGRHVHCRYARSLHTTRCCMSPSSSSPSSLPSSTFLGTYLEHYSHRSNIFYNNHNHYRHHHHQQGQKRSYSPSTSVSSQLSHPSDDPFTTLKAAIKELSGQNYFMVSVSTPEELMAWNLRPMEELELDQLEELARALFEGSVEGLEANIEKSIELWQLADKLGSLEARYCLASCIRDGVVFEEDPELAFKMFEELATKCEFPIAYYMLGLMYNRGVGVPKDLAKAFSSFKTATDNGVTRAFYELSTFYDSGKVVTKNEELAVKCLEVAVESNDLLAKHALALHYYKGMGCEVNRARAFELQIQAADGGHPAAMFNVAIHYLSGEGVPSLQPDVLKAAEYFEKSRKGGVIPAVVNLVSLYRGNHDHPKNLLKAKALLESINSSNNEEFKSILKEIESEIAEENKLSK